MSSPLMNLRSMLGLKQRAGLSALQNVGGNVGNMGAQELDAAQGLGMYEPSEAELMAAQTESVNTMPSGSFTQMSREKLREGAMAMIKRKLAEGATAQSYKLQQEDAQTKRDLAKQRLTNEGTGNVARIQTEGKAAQAEAAANAKQAALDALLQGVGNSGRSISVPGVGSVGPKRAAPAGGRMQQPTDQQMKRLTAARGNFEGFSPFSTMYEKFTGKPSGERTAYGNELEGILDRTGNLADMQDIIGQLGQYPGATVDEKVQAAMADEAFDYDLNQLGPYEKEYLKFKLGQ